MGAFAGPLRFDVGYEVVRQGNLWQLAYVNVCPAPKYASACGEVVEYKGQRYRRYVNPPGVGSGVATVLGFGLAIGCGPDPVNHIGVYSAPEQPVSEKVIVVMRDQRSPGYSDIGELTPIK